MAESLRDFRYGTLVGGHSALAAICQSNKLTVDENAVAFGTRKLKSEAASRTASHSDMRTVGSSPAELNIE